MKCPSVLNTRVSDLTLRWDGRIYGVEVRYERRVLSNHLDHEEQHQFVRFEFIYSLVLFFTLQ